ncbi:cardiolipin synthase [Methylobacterium durans]|uniref:cardiolipin synthase n=1 Tax=Methylobacterium durans TaxID=2202825 RepID=UPI002AFDF734|nr:cardiolipin synthase [Methylobacterium durans]MEA1831726.1 cardiolipin synthase [Methylobacterium durans]
MEDALRSWLVSSAAIRSDILALLGFGLAVAAMIHALLHKREVGAAISWIGLVWLSPILGTVLYALLGVNRVSRRARQLSASPSRQADEAPSHAAPVRPAFASLDHAVRQITRLPIRAGNAVQVLRNGDEAYPAMLSAIAAAERSVALSSYIFRDDGIGGAFLDALVAARSRGAEVRVIIDGIGSGYFSHRIYRRARRAGVPVGLFMHSALPWRMPFLNLRTHKKLLIVDGATAFTGGINIADENRVALQPPDPVRDTHFRIAGPVVEQLTMAFASDWAFVRGEELEGERWFPALAPAGESLARVVTSGPDADIEKIELVMLQAMTCARRSIRLATPYFLPNEVLASVLSLAAVRGLSVDVIIPRVSNHRLVDWATRAHVDPLLASGVRIWLNEPPFDHSKMLVVDEEWSFVGSANWDMRSFRLNFELNVEVYDAGLADALGRSMERTMTARLTQADLARRSIPAKLRDAGARLFLPYL